MEKENALVFITSFLILSEGKFKTFGLSNFASWEVVSHSVHGALVRGFFLFKNIFSVLPLMFNTLFHSYSGPKGFLSSFFYCHKKAIREVKASEIRKPLVMVS